MRRVVTCLLAASFLLTVLVACAETAKTIAKESQSERTDVFKEVAGGETIPEGYADVIIRANIETHLEGYYVLETEDLHGKPGYPFLINIDGQASTWKVDGVTNIKPKYRKDDGRSRDPEAGEGMKYVLEKRIRLAAGPHKVFFGLPEEAYFVTTDINVKNGKLYVLEFLPRYKHEPKPDRPTFLKGIRAYDVMFNETDAGVQ